MNTTRIKLTQIACSLFPPTISQYLRNMLYPRKLGIIHKINFSKKSITGSIFQSNTEDFHGFPFLFHGFFDWRNIIIANSIFKKNKGDIIEIGANIGTETISYCDIAKKKGNVFAFEPLPNNFECLKNISNTHKHLQIYQKAISNIKGEISFLVPPDTDSGTGKIITENQSISDNIIKVETVKLDDFDKSFSNVELICIDTEGHEPFVLEGSENIIIKHRPVVIIEVSPQLLAKYANSNSESISSFFEQKNYSVFKINRFSISIIKNKDLITNKASNWVCIPKEINGLDNLIKRDLFLRSIIPWYLLKTLPNNV
jgi:FkbM family methyltransferase